VQDESLIAFGDNFTGELWLFYGGINNAVFMVFKDSEILVQANVEGRWLDHGLMEWFAGDATCFDLGEDVAIT
jgi:hypothetical protein